MPEPGLELEQGHRLFCVEQLRGDGGPRSVAGDASSSVLEWHPRLAAEERDYSE